MLNNNRSQANCWPKQKFPQKQISSIKDGPPLKCHRQNLLSSQYVINHCHFSHQIMVAIYFSIRVQRKFSFGTKWIIFYDVEITRINDTLTSRNKLKKHSLLPKIVLTFHCLNKLFQGFQKFCKFSAFSLEFQKFFLVNKTIFSHTRSEQFW